MNFIFWVLIGYLVGSIPFGYLLAKFIGHIDVRDIGSGSTGATNVFRSGHKILGIITLLLDFFKGWILCIICDNTPEIYIAAFACLIGHAFPVWLRWHGGKCVATAAGIFLALSPIPAFISILLWGTTLVLSHLSALASLVLASSFSIMMVMGYWNGSINIEKGWFSGVVLLLLLFTHRQNLKRLTQHREARLKL